MKQFTFINAYKALEQIADNANLTKKDQWNLYKLRVMLRPHVEFQEEQERIVRGKYAEYADENGILTGEKAAEFAKEMQSIVDTEIEYEPVEKIRIEMVDGITFKTIEALEEFIEFLPPED